MAGPWENYQSGSESGPWQKYGAAPPSAPPPVPKPPNPILTQEEGWDPITPGNAATGFLKSLYQTSAPGIAASIAQKHAPQAAQSIPESLKGMPLEQVPAAAIATFFGGEEPTTQLAEHTVTAPGAMALPKIGKPGMVSRVAEHLPVIGKGVRLYNLGREMFGREEAPPAPAPPAPVPQTNGIEWGTGGQGPLDLRGKQIPQDAQALPAIEKPAPRSTWPPNAPRYNPESKVELPKPKPFRDVQEDQMIQDAMRQDLSAHEQSAAMTAAKEFAAGNSMSTPKSTLIERARDQMNPWSNQPKAPEAPAKPVAPSKPVAPEAPDVPRRFYSRFSSVRDAGQAVPPSALTPGEIPENLRPLLQEARTKAQAIAEKHGLGEMLDDVYLVGSRAKGTPRPNSDVDILVKLNNVKEYVNKEGKFNPELQRRVNAMSNELEGELGGGIKPGTREADIPSLGKRKVDAFVEDRIEPNRSALKFTAPAPPSEDLTGILRQSVKQVREKKAGSLPAVSGGSESLPKVESASESASFKRANPPQVAQPTVLKRNVPFESMTGNREIQNLQADEYILPGLEEYRIGIVKPRGSIAARNKLGFEAYELNSGRLIFHEPYQGSTLDRTLSGAMKVLQSQGKAKIDAAIGGAIRK